MKKQIRRLLACALLAALTVCGALTAAAGAAVGQELLPLEISQQDWADSRKYVTLSTGITMAYVEMGDPNGEPLILQHGMTDNSRSWSFAAPYFAKAGYHVYIPELRGMGRTDTPDGWYTVTSYGTDMAAFLDAVGVDRAIVVGHSLGSFTAQAFCLMFPERCSKLVLVSSLPLRGLQNPTLARAYHAYVEPLPEDGHPSDAFMDVWYACEPKEDGIRAEFNTFISYMKKEAQVLPRRAWKNIFLGMIAGTLEDAYTEYDPSIPVLILHGDEDTMTETQYQEELCSLFHVTEGSYRNYPGIGHNVQFEMPERCAQDILGWLRTGTLPE